MKDSQPALASELSRSISIVQAAFVGVGAMVGAGIFALLGVAGAVSGSAVWLSFVMGGLVASLQGYSFAKLGTRFVSPLGMLEYLRAGFGDGWIAGVSTYLALMSSLIMMAMVTATFGQYAAAVLFGDGAGNIVVVGLAVAGLLLILVVNLVGRNLAAKVGAWMVWIVIGILAGFVVVTLPHVDASALSPSTYPPLREIVGAVALTFFAFLGFGTVTFTAVDLRDPARELTRAMYLAIGLTTVLYTAIAVVTFGALGTQGVISAGQTALAEAARPALGTAGFSIMAITALFSTASTLNSNLYPAGGMTAMLANEGRLPPVFGATIGKRRLPAGLIVIAGMVLVTAALLDLEAIASLGSTVALVLFLTISLGHLRIRSQTGASAAVLGAAGLTTAGTLVIFAATTLRTQSATMAAFSFLLLLAIGTEGLTRRRRAADEDVARTTADQMEVL